MSAKTLMANESLLQRIEEQVEVLRKHGGVLVKRHGDAKFSFSEGVELVQEYEGALVLLREAVEMLYPALDVCDPEDNELHDREAAEEEDAEDDEDDEEEDDEEEGDEEDDAEDEEDGDEEEGEDGEEDEA